MSGAEHGKSSEQDWGGESLAAGAGERARHGWPDGWPPPEKTRLEGEGFRPVPTDPRSDPRPEARSIFNRAFVDVPEAVRLACVNNRRAVSTGDVKEAWRHTDWFQMPIIPLNGGTTIVCREEDFMEALPHLGTAKLAYHAEENFVCRNYSALFASVVAAELECNVAMVCDDGGHHMYSAVPVLANAGDAGQHVKFLIVEPQGDSVVPHTNPGRHYVGKAGFALLI